MNFKINIKTIQEGKPIIDLFGGIGGLVIDDVFKYFEKNYEYRSADCMQDEHIGNDSSSGMTDDLYPVVASGIVGYWLHEKGLKRTTDILESYYRKRLNEYRKEHENDSNAWRRDFEREFLCRYHIYQEKNLIKISEALFAYITPYDKCRVKDIASNYLAFVRDKRWKKCTKDYPQDKVLQKTFLDVFRPGGAAHETMLWMRREYNLPVASPEIFDSYKDEWGFGRRVKERHENYIPEFVAEEREYFDESRQNYSELIDEIHENIKKYQTQDDIQRYIISLLQPFKEFAEAFDYKAHIDRAKRIIKLKEENLKEYESKLDDFKDTDSDMNESTEKRKSDCIHWIESCKKDIDYYKKDIEYYKKVEGDFYWFAQHGCGAGHYRPDPYKVNKFMCENLAYWWKIMVLFAKKLASLLLTYGINLIYVQEICEVYLLHDFSHNALVDNKFITSGDHAQRLLDKIDDNIRRDKSKSDDTDRYKSISLAVENDGVKAVNGNPQRSSNPNKLPLPAILDTKDAQKYFKMAIKRGYMKCGNGRFKWMGIDNMENKSQLAYMCGKIYGYRHSENGNKGDRFPEDALGKLFDVNRLQALLNQVHNAKKKQPWRRIIDEMFR